MNADVKQQLFEAVEADFPDLASLGPDRVYDSLASICMQEGKPVTVEQMLQYAVILDNDLEMDDLQTGD